MIAALKKENFEAEEAALVPNCLVTNSGGVVKTEAFAKGLFYVQDLSSQLLGSLVDADASEAIIDIGSAPGGKAAYFSQSMKGKGHIVAIENSASRIKILEHNMVRLGVDNIEVINHDATADIEAFHDKANKLVVDAPCSALGVIRRHPEKKWGLTADEMKQFPKIQLKILDTVKSWVKKGGWLFYSTCTINPEENEKVIEKFLDTNSGFRPEDICGDVSRLKTYKNKKYFTSLPGNPHNMDGFFIAKIKRVK